MDKSKGLELAKKLLAHKQKGFGGEAENAAKMLAHILKKYDITEAEIEGERLEVYFFKVFRKGTEKRKLAFQIVSSVLGNTMTYREHRTDTSKILLEVTQAQYIELTEKLAAYIGAYEKHMKDVVDRETLAFVIANQIFYPEPPKSWAEQLEQAIKQQELPEEEKARLLKARRAAAEIEPTIINKLLK